MIVAFRARRFHRGLGHPPISVTERKRMEAALAEQADFNRQVFDSTDVHLAVVGPDGVILAINAAWQRFAEENAGGDESKWGVGTHYFVPCAEKWGDSGLASDAFEGIRNVQSGQWPTFSLEYPCHGPGDQRHWFVMRVVPLRGREGTVLVSHTNITELKRAENAIRKNNELLCSFVRHSPIFAYIKVVTPTESRILKASENFLDLLGIPGSELEGKSMAEIFPAEFAAKITADDWAVVSSGKVLQVDEDFNSRRYTTFKFPISQDGRNLLAGYILDITDRHEMEKALRESEQRYRLLANYANDVIWTTNLEGQLTYVSPAVFPMRGFTPEEAMGQPLEQAVCPGSRATMQEEFGNLFAEIKTGRWPPARYFEIEQPRKDGTTVWTEGTARVMYDAAGQPVGLVGVTRDITERKRLQKELRQQAITDDLTGISNRRHFIGLAQGELKRAVRSNRPLALALIDIDHFKHINDTHGHMAGDQVLEVFTKICQKTIRETDLFARFGGDEFVVLLPETNREQAHEIVERVRLALAAARIDLGGQSAPITLSAGIASLANTRESLDALLVQADQALYKAKEKGRNLVIVSSTPRRDHDPANRRFEAISARHLRGLQTGNGE